MTYSELHEYCMKQGYWVNILTGRHFLKITVYYGDSYKEANAEDQYQEICSGTDKPERADQKPSVNKAAKKCAVMLKMFEGSKRAKWWETERERKHPELRVSRRMPRDLIPAFDGELEKAIDDRADLPYDEEW